MSVIFTEELDRMRVDLNEAERKMHKAEFDKSQALKQYRVEADRAAALERQLAEGSVEADALRRQVVKARQDADRLAPLEGEISQARQEALHYKAEMERLTDMLYKRKQDLDETRQELSDAKAELVTLRSELGPTRKLLSSLKTYIQAESEIQTELERLHWEEV